MEKKTKRKLIFITSLVVIVAVALVWAWFHFFGGKDDYCSVIPKDATAVLRVDVKTFVQEHNLDFEGLKSLAGEDAAKQVDESGIDFTKPIYAFTESNGIIGLLLPIADADNMKDFIADHALFFGGGKVTERQGYKWVESMTMVGAFDDEKMLILSGAGMNSRKIILSMMEQDEDESVLESDLYKNLQKADKPISLIALAKALPEQVRTAISTSLNLDVESNDFDLSVLATFDFEKDKAILAAEYLANNDVTQDKLDKFADNLHKIDGTFISTVTKHPALWGAFSGKSIADFSMLSSLTELKQFNIDLTKLQPLFKGDVCVVVPSFQQKSFLVQTETESNDPLSVIDPLCKNSNGQLKSMMVGQDSYCITSGSQPFFAGIANKTFYLTNSSELSKVSGKDADSDIEDLEDDIEDSYFFVTADIQSLLHVFLLQPMVGQYIALFSNRLQQLDRLTLRCTSPTRSELTISTKDGKDFVETVLK